MNEATNVRFIETSGPVASLAPIEDGGLLDAVSGRWWSADEVVHYRGISYGFPFDRAVVFGPFCVLYVERGTKALLLKDNELVRELNRSYYCADSYDYPVALGALPDGRVVVIHCPDEYNILEIEDAETGERLTAGDRQPTDVFHSRLEISPDGRRLLSAGWFWHPYGVVAVYDLEAALQDPAALDGDGILATSAADHEVLAARWIDADRVAVAFGDPVLDDAADLPLNELAVWSCADSTWVHRNKVDAPLGELLACGESIISLYGHPRRISLATGDIIAEWPDLELPKRQGSFASDEDDSPIATALPGGRIAIAHETGIAILKLAD
jgi:hypothetical protein